MTVRSWRQRGTGYQWLVQFVAWLGWVFDGSACHRCGLLLQCRTHPGLRLPLLHRLASVDARHVRSSRKHGIADLPPWPVVLLFAPETKEKTLPDQLRPGLDFHPMRLIFFFMDNNLTPQALTHDEKKAAEAAFAGRPFNPKWSERARVVYDGIVGALPTAAVESQEAAESLEATIVPDESVEAGSATKTEDSSSDQTEQNKPDSETLPTRIPFEQALASGALIDVTTAAKQVGFSFPVAVTKPLWEVGIAPSKTLTQEEQSNRLRDVLMAFRLRLATQPTISPLIDFPALLALPPNSVPQPIPLFALIQPDEQNRAMVTLLLPNEVAATIIPMN